jgi:hypothetical protein
MERNKGWFKKGHTPVGGLNTRFQKGNIPAGGFDTRFKKGHDHQGREFTEETRRKMSESKRGEKNHLWRGGVSQCYKLHTTERKWKKQSARVFKRDNYQCQLCGSNKKLNAHHVIPWRVEHNDKMSNLITLCDSCHRRIEYKWWQYTPLFFEILGVYKQSNEKTLFN